MPHLVVHGHFYQPPRENPWTELIDRQPSAAPFRDWNARVSDECYDRIGAAIVRGPDGRVASLVNLFSRISFNIGPTLAAWLEHERPAVLAAAAAGDRDAISRSGAGSALMQPFGHAILPLCAPRERRLQLAWGIADFRRRFGREPLGVWLSECAVDLPTLEDCAALGLRYTILAPEQIARVRPLSGGEWTDVSGDKAPTTRPLLVRLPSGATFTVFVFHGPLSRSAAFSGVLRGRGDAFLDSANAALAAIPAASGDADAILLVACDGETFGHHQKGAEDALADALQRARLSGQWQVSQLGDLLQRVTPQHEAQLVEPSSWSCTHGVGRWSRDCGCGFVGPEGWSHAWRETLRRGVSQLQTRILTLIDRRGAELLRDPWLAIERYGDVLAQPGNHEAATLFVAEHAAPGLDAAGQRRALMLLELVRQTLFAATSCGWFFDDIAGIEAVQVLRHAARASELCRAVFGIDPEPDFIASLSGARANAANAGKGDDVYRQQALSAKPSAMAIAARWMAQQMKAGAFVGAAAPMHGEIGAYRVSASESPRVTKHEARSTVAAELDVTHTRSGETTHVSLSVQLDTPFALARVTANDAPLELGHDLPVVDAWLDEQAQRLIAQLPMPSDEWGNALQQLGVQAGLASAELPAPLSDHLRGRAVQAMREALRPSSSSNR
ncbi:MAG: DUF3536 domain-containing protein [Acidobacteriota bacterium]